MARTDAMEIDHIAFLGRTYYEYLHIFHIHEPLLSKSVILDCPAGPSSFAATACAKGFNVVACDAIYNLGAEELFKKGGDDIEYVFRKFDSASHLFTWDYYENKEEVVAFRSKALELFAADFSRVRKNGRYVQAELPLLPFPDNAFSLVLSGHFLFLYGEKLNLDFHKACLKEMARVCRGEIRIFPLAGHDAKQYPRLEEVRHFLDCEHIDTEVVKTPFEFQRGANFMMRLRKKP